MLTKQPQVVGNQHLTWACLEPCEVLYLATEIEKTAKEIDEACNKFFGVRAKMLDMMDKGTRLDVKFSEVAEKIGEGLRELHTKSKVIEEAWRLNVSQFEQGRIERDGYERRLMQLTEEMSRIGFAFHQQVRIELESFERHLNIMLKQWGIPSVLPSEGQELELKVANDKKEKLEALVRSVDETKEELREVGAQQITENPEAYKRLGVFYAQSRNWKKASEYYERALAIKPKDAIGWRGLGYTLFKQRNYNEAIACYEKALEINKKDAATYYNLGTVYDEKGNYNQAIACYEKALEIKPNFAPVWCNLGTVYDEKGNYNQAIACYEKALEINKENAAIWCNLGTVYDEKGNYNQAIACYEKALEIKPNFAPVWCNLGMVYQRLGNENEAKKCMNKAKQLGHN
jgi:tetratricopeptide (TPR) repeat protein